MDVVPVINSDQPYPKGRFIRTIWLWKNTDEAGAELADGMKLQKQQKNQKKRKSRDPDPTGSS